MTSRQVAIIVFKDINEELNEKSYNLHVFEQRACACVSCDREKYTHCPSWRRQERTRLPNLATDNQEIDSSRKRLCHQTYFTVKHFVSLLSFCAPFWECLYGTEGHCDATSHCCALFYCSFISRDVLFLVIPLQSLMTLLIPSIMFDRKVIKRCDQMERFKLNGSNETIRLTRNQG